MRVKRRKRVPFGDEIVVTSDAVLNRGKTVIFVIRMHDDGFQFLSLSEEDEVAQAVHFHDLCSLDGTLAAVGTLKIGEMALRQDCNSSWQYHQFGSAVAFDEWVTTGIFR